VTEEDIESYWDTIRPPRKPIDPLEVIMSEEDVRPLSAQEQFQRERELGHHLASMTSLPRGVLDVELHIAQLNDQPLRPARMFMNREAFDDIQAWSHAADQELIAETAALADGILNNRNPESFHNLEDTLPLRDLQLALQTLGYACETWVNEEGRLCIQFHGLAEQSWGTRCVGGELRLTIWNPHA